MNGKRLAEGSDADKKYLAEHPALGAWKQRLDDTQREIYLKPALAAAIVALRQAEREPEASGE